MFIASVPFDASVTPLHNVLSAKSSRGWRGVTASVLA